MEVEDVTKEEAEGKLSVVHYAGDEIMEWEGTKIPTFLKFVYFILPIWGILWFYLYTGGSNGWLDRGSWSELQKAANTIVEESPFSSKTASKE